MNNKKLWNPAAVVIALSVAFSTAHASALEQTGTPGSAAPLGTYGVDVSTKAGLKSLLPPGWNLYIYKNTPLPSTISWNVQDTWLTALDRFAGSNTLAVRVDWASNSLFVSTPEIAREDREKRAQLDAAAKTPLPVYTAANGKNEATAKPLDISPAAKASLVEPVAASARISPDVLARAVARTATADAAAKAALATAPTAADAPQRSIVVPERVKPIPAPHEALLAEAARTATSAPVQTPSAAPLASLAMPTRAAAPIQAGTPTSATLPQAQPLPSATKQVKDVPVTVVQAPVKLGPAVAPAVIPAPVMPPALAAAVAMTQAPASSGAMTSAGVIQVAPKPAVSQAPAPAVALPVAAAQRHAQAPVVQSAAEAFTRGSLEDIVRTDAQKHGYQVSWETISLQLDGPVTLLGVDPAEDMRLLQRALGNKRSPIAVEVYRGSSLIRVVANNGSRQPLAVFDSTYSGTLGSGPRGPAQIASVVPPASQPVILPAAVRPVATAPAVVPSRAPSAAPAVQPVAPTKLHLHVAKGESLSKALAAFLATQKWEMRWQLQGDMEADFPVDLSGTDIKQVLKSLLPKLGLDTEMYAPSRVVVIHPINNTAE